MYKKSHAPAVESNRIIVWYLSMHFGETVVKQLFIKIHLWYHSQPKTRERSVEEEALSVYSTYVHKGTLPEFFKILYVLLQTREHLPQKEYCKYSRVHAHNFWRYVFIKYFGYKPRDNKDKHFDELFKIGIPIYQMLEEDS